MTSISYEKDMDQFNSDGMGLDRQDLHGAGYIKNLNELGGSNQTFSTTSTFSFTKLQDITSSKSTSIGGAYHITWKAEAKIPEIATVSVEHGLEAHFEKTTLNSETNGKSQAGGVTYTQASTRK
jgi:hypothetical protein